jgi:hypothetical protein
MKRGPLFIILAGLSLPAASIAMAADDGNPAADATAPDGKRIHAATYIDTWMIGRFFGTNEGMLGHIVELQISPVGHVIAVVDRQIVFDGQIEGDRLTVDGVVFIVTRTDEGLRTQQADDTDNIVYYTRA